MALTAEQIEEQKKQAEEMLFDEEHEHGFATSLFFGKFIPSRIFPYPQLEPEEKATVEAAVKEVRQFAAEHIDAAAIDQGADIPQDVIDGLGRLGVLGMTAPEEFGGRGFSQMGYCKIMEVIGGHCGSTSVFVNAHHSIGIRALILAGTEEQKRKWLPDLASGKKLGAFALTEPEAGSDAANVQTEATPNDDGTIFRINGEKRYITNGGIAQMLTVMARTPVEGSDATKVTAFLVTPDMPGFEVVEARMPKCGIRGTATARLAFHDVPVPAANILGKRGKGLRVALTVLDYGRTTFGACCTGAAKTALRLAVEHAKGRKQFGQALSEFELVKKKIAFMAAHTFAMEAMTASCAGLIDSGAEDYMVETAALKVFTTEHLWTIVNDLMQIYGGKGYFSDQPVERMMRDARINQIGEGANDVLRVFIATVGFRAVGEGLKDVLEASKHPLKEFGTLFQFGRSQISQRFTTPEIPVASSSLHGAAKELAKRVRDFGLAVQKTLIHLHRLSLKDPSTAKKADEELRVAQQIFKRQYLEERLADAACDLYASACTLSRLDHILQHGPDNPDDPSCNEEAGRYFLALANRRIHERLNALWDNDDELATTAADAAIGNSQHARG